MSDEIKEGKWAVIAGKVAILALIVAVLGLVPSIIQAIPVIRAMQAESGLSFSQLISSLVESKFMWMFWFGSGIAITSGVYWWRNRDGHQLPQHQSAPQLSAAAQPQQPPQTHLLPQTQPQPVLQVQQRMQAQALGSLDQAAAIIGVVAPPQNTNPTPTANIAAATPPPSNPTPTPAKISASHQQSCAIAFVDVLHLSLFGTPAGNDEMNQRVALYVLDVSSDSWKCLARSDLTTTKARVWPALHSVAGASNCGLVAYAAYHKKPQYAVAPETGVGRPQPTQTQTQKYLKDSRISEAEHKKRTWAYSSLYVSPALDRDGNIKAVLGVEQREGGPIVPLVNNLADQKEQLEQQLQQQIALAGTLWATLLNGEVTND